MNAPALYNRKASLIIGNASTGVELTGLRIVFEVKKTSTSHANTANIKVYNLAAETRNMILAKKTALILRAGYGDAYPLPLLASGVVQRVEHASQPPEVETDIEIRDGGLGLDGAQFRKAYAAQTPLAQIVRDIAATMSDVTLGSMLAVASGKIPSKRCFSGPARLALDKLASAFGFEWSVQNGVLQVLERKKGTTNTQVSATVLSKTTGLIGAPTKTNAGCKATSLLMPHILPGTFIKTEHEFCSGTYKVLTVEHKGDTYGDDDWTTTSEAKSIARWVGPGAKSKGKK
jgi:hypothetical protein